MDNIKIELESIIFEVMLPESQAFLAELTEELDNGNDEEEILKAKKDVESFIEELGQVLKLLDEDKISDEDAQIMYDKIRAMLDEHVEEKE